MNSIEELIQHYEQEFERYDKEANSYETKNIALYEWFNGSRVQIRNFLYQLKNLPNELRAVNRNEQLKEFERYKCNHCGRIFKKKCVHNCNTGLRKRHQSYSIITLSEND